MYFRLKISSFSPCCPGFRRLPALYLNGTEQKGCRFVKSELSGIGNFQMANPKMLQPNGGPEMRPVVKLQVPRMSVQRSTIQQFARFAEASEPMRHDGLTKSLVRAVCRA